MVYSLRIYKATKQRRWTRSAIECYQIGCVCKNCSLFEIMGYQCKMKGAVIELVRTIGIPDGTHTEVIDG